MSQKEESWGEFLEENPDAAAQFHGLWVHAQVVAQTTGTDVSALMMMLPMLGDSFHEYAWPDSENDTKGGPDE